MSRGTFVDITVLSFNFTLFQFSCFPRNYCGVSMIHRLLLFSLQLMLELNKINGRAAQPLVFVSAGYHASNYPNIAPQ